MLLAISLCLEAFVCASCATNRVTCPDLRDAYKVVIQAEDRFDSTKVPKRTFDEDLDAVNEERYFSGINQYPEKIIRLHWALGHCIAKLGDPAKIRDVVASLAATYGYGYATFNLRNTYGIAIEEEGFRLTPFFQWKTAMPQASGQAFEQ